MLGGSPFKSGVLTMMAIVVVRLIACLVWALLPHGHRYEAPLGQAIGVSFIATAVVWAFVPLYLLTLFDLAIGAAYIAKPRGFDILRWWHER